MSDTSEHNGYWAGEPYGQLLERIAESLSVQEPLTLVSGDQGSGKSALAEALVDRLTALGDVVIWIEQPPDTLAQLQQLICARHSELDSFAFMVSLERWLQQLDNNNQRCILVLDNGQDLNVEVTNGIRVMNNLQSSTRCLLQAVIFAEPPMLKQLRQEKNGGLLQRVSQTIEMPQLTRQQVDKLLSEHYSVALQPDALTLLLKLSRGNPGLVTRLGKQLANEDFSGPISARRIKQLLPDSTQSATRYIGYFIAAATVLALALYFTHPLTTDDQYSSTDTPNPPARPQVQKSQQKPQHDNAPEKPEKAPTSTAEPLLAIDTEGPVETPALSLNVSDETAAKAIDTVTLLSENSQDASPAISDNTWETPALGTVAPQADTRNDTPSTPIPTGVNELLQRWVTAWQAKDIDTYIDCYTRDFRPSNNSNHHDWAEHKRQRIKALSQVQITLKSPNLIESDNESARIEVWLNYISPGYQDETLKILVLAKQGSQWRIAREANKKVRHNGLTYTTGSNTKSRDGER